jgi:hypothetical protein
MIFRFRHLAQDTTRLRTLVDVPIARIVCGFSRH